jgi:hypothetical protein
MSHVSPGLRALPSFALAALTVLALITPPAAVHANEETGKGGARPIRGRIHGFKWDDRDGNGQQDSGESRLSGVTIRLRNLGPYYVKRETVTDENGEYRFRNLPLQRYEVCEVTPPGTFPTTPECVEVKLSRRHRHRTVNFGNREEHDNGGGEGCTRTQGFWGSSPAGQALLVQLVPGTLTLGTTAYTAAQLDDILDKPTQGNALLILAHQLIAARLNVLAGADDSAIAATLTAADAAIGGLVIPPVGSDFVAPNTQLGQTMVSLATTLASYNEGDLNVPHCP